MKINLHYGQASITLQIPKANIEQIIRPCQSNSNADNSKLIKQSLACQEAEDFRKHIAGQILCVLLNDGTRDVPVSDMLCQLLPLAKECLKVKFIICTGSHDTQTLENIQIKQQVEELAVESGIHNFEVHIHNCESDKFTDVGQTSFGTQVLCNSKVRDAGLFLVLSDVKCHYFAGYSNPVKNFVPGICAFSTVENNHQHALEQTSACGIHPWHNDKNRRDNPVAADQLEAMNLIVLDKSVYAMVTVSNSGKISWVRFGKAEKVSRKTFDVADRLNTHTVNKVKYIVVSAGGLPNDIDLYIAQRALENIKPVVMDKGEILFLTACPKGVGSKRTDEHFYKLLTKPLKKNLRLKKSQYKLFSHKPYKFAQLIQRLHHVWMYSEIADATVRSMHLCPTDNPQSVIDGWLDKDPSAKILFVDGANKVALYAKNTAQQR